MTSFATIFIHIGPNLFSRKIFNLGRKMVIFLHCGENTLVAQFSYQGQQLS